MGLLFDALYEATKKNIEQNPCKITWPRYPLKDNGRGAMVPDTGAAPKQKTAIVRIAHEKPGVTRNEEGSGGLSTNLSKFALMTPDVDLVENDIITEAATGMKWKAGPVDSFTICGQAYMKQAPLTRADG